MVDSIQDTAYMLGSGSASAYNYLTANYNPYNNMGYMNSIMMPYCGYGYGYDPQAYSQYYNAMTDANLNMQHKSSAANTLMNAPEQAVERQMGNLQRQVLRNNQDNIEAEYRKLYDEVSKMYSDEGYTPSDSQIRAYIENTYATKTGSRLVDDVENHGTNPFVQGMIQGTGIGYIVGNKTTASENVSLMTGEEVSTGEKAATWAGRAIGFVATALALPFVAKFGGKAAKTLVKGYASLLKA